MFFITYQPKDYKEYKNPRYKDVKKTLGIPEDQNIYWCIKANNLVQAVLNSYCVEPNQPYYMVMFETDDYYEVDAAKWNYDVECALNVVFTESHLEIEHGNDIEYIVTNIPEKKLEIPVPIMDLFKYPTSKEEKSQEMGEFYVNLVNALSYKNSYGKRLMDTIRDLYPSEEEHQKTLQEIWKSGTLADNSSIQDAMPTELLEIKLFYEYFVGILLPAVYLAAKNVFVEDTDQYPMNLRQWDKNVMLKSKYAEIYADIKDIDSLATSIKSYKRMVYKEFFVPVKTPYPNEPCPCGSGMKYKKCCAKFEDKLEKLLSE